MVCGELEILGRVYLQCPITFPDAKFSFERHLQILLLVLIFVKKIGAVFPKSIGKGILLIQPGYNALQIGDGKS
jgi:hypothetical protein